MLILAIDTASNIGTVALYDDIKGMIAEINLNAKRNHSVIIMEAINSLFTLSEISKEMVDKIVVSIGPGSFTGIRIGVGLAKGLAYALKKPIAGINELDIVANMYSGEKPIIAMLDARKERVFYGTYNVEKGMIVSNNDYNVLELSEVLKMIKHETVFVGEGAIIYKEIIKERVGKKAIFINNALNLTRASVLAELGKQKVDNIFTLEPYYLVKSQAERELQKRERS